MRTAVPEGATYVRSEPQGKLQGDEVVWHFDKMHKGEYKDLKVWFRPNGEGDFTSCTTVHALPMACVLTKVRTPNLTILKEGPESAAMNSDVTYTITVTNDGTAPAEDVVITDIIPRGMSFDGSSEPVSFEVGTLDPGESKKVKLELRANERGTFCNESKVSASNANSASSEACTKIVQKDIDITKTGPAQTYIGKSATYSIRVTNTGDTELTDVVVRDSADRSTDIISADGADISGDSAKWEIDRLGPGESRSFTVTIESDEAGTFCNEASVSSKEGVSDSAEACTEWQGFPAILMELVDMHDPLLVGETTTYKVRITNQGSAEDTNIGVRLMFPSQIQPMSASGATDGTVSGRSVSFAPYDTLEAGQSIEFFVEGKATGKGDARIKLELDSDLLRRPVSEEESTHVY